MAPTAVAGRDLFDPADLADPYPLYALLRTHAPVCQIGGTDFYVASSWDLVADAATRVEEFSSNLTGVLLQQSDGSLSTFDMDSEGRGAHVLATADEPVHAAHRKLVLPAMSKRIRRLEPVVDGLVEQLWSEQVHRGHIDWAQGMADRLPLSVMARLIGLPEQDVSQLLSWAYDSTEMLGGVIRADRLEPLMTSASELAEYLRARFTEAKQRPGDDLLGVLAAASGNGELDEDTAVLILVQLVGAGGESTAGLIANAARLLADRPELQKRLRANPTLIKPFLEEMLRLESPFRNHHRHVTTDTTLGGTSLPADSHLLLLWGSANRDPRTFDAPDELELERPAGRAHLGFGKGAHFCIGSALARMEARAAIGTLLARTTRIDLDEHHPPEWVPSVFVRRHRTLPLAI